MKDTVKSVFANITMSAFLSALRENARRSYKKKPKRILTHQHPGVRNPAIAAQMNAMHDRWFAVHFANSPQP